jgi:hypothetical protein
MIKTRLSFQFKKEENEAAGSLNDKNRSYDLTFKTMWLIVIKQFL